MKIEFDFEISNGSKVVILISLGLGSSGTELAELTGIKLKNLINSLKEKECDITVLIADALHKYNCGSIEEALQKGANYRAENYDVLQTVNVIHWQDYCDSKQEAIESKRKAIDEVSPKGSLLYNKMIRTCNLYNADKKQKILLENSLLYQKEEYAVYLAMTEFDYVIYPKVISAGLHCLYQTFPEIRSIKYRQAKFLAYKAEDKKILSFFKEENKRHALSFNFGLKNIFSNVMEAINSEEISPQMKIYFLEQLHNISGQALLELEEQRAKASKKLSVN